MSGNNRLFIIYSSIFVIQATAFWFALPPVKMEKGLRITVTDMNDWEFVTETTNPVAITRNEVQPMEAIPFVSDKPYDYQLFYTTANGGFLCDRK